jgi:hypothetical protein
MTSLQKLILEYNHLIKKHPVVSFIFISIIINLTLS